MNKEEESSARKEMVLYIQEIGQSYARFPSPTIFTAITMVYRFYVRNSFKNHQFREVGLAALFLAGKIEETPRKLKEVALVSLQYDHRLSESETKKGSPMPGTEELLSHPNLSTKMERILLYEKMLLQALCYDLSFHHPYMCFKDLHSKYPIDARIYRVARTFLNDSYLIPLCLLYMPEYIASACFLLAFKILDQNDQAAIDTVFSIIHSQKDGHTKDAVDPSQIKLDMVSEIALKILGLYSPTTKP
jgi:hypothetical protein